jgi:hypothetical protein
MISYNYLSPNFLSCPTFAQFHEHRPAIGVCRSMLETPKIVVSILVRDTWDE